ncbi:hypothetical protein [Nocardia sp. NPDC050435]|uniref:hypothetical protein n=1 Tax=Nocardia sp. NPDC050435 TaxID=3155040 RepID=UPI0033CD1F42
MAENYSVRNSGPAIAAPGGVAVSGILHGDIYQASVPLPQSEYLRQVRQLAPEKLEGRDAELAELAAFAASEGSPSWQWWQAPAWWGKSALMSWFVTHPPPAVTVVSFFVTSRWAGQSDYIAFTDIVIEQLAEIAGRPIPAFLTDATRNSHLLAMLDAAASVCRDSGRTLVLLIDGIDEDHGMVPGPAGHSIAALLPALPPDGVRILLSGRPVAVPSDVEGNHPLHDTSIVRALSQSSQATVIRTAAERELQRLLYGTSSEQDLLGLVVASGGGLTAADLADLLGISPGHVADQLGSVTGRSFSARPSLLDPAARPHNYILAHEELQQIATSRIGATRLGEYRDEIHAWADRYRAHQWPESTPEYLLRGYFSLLTTLGDSTRMSMCAIDWARHDRMRVSSGGDSSALVEVAAAQEALCHDLEPDLGTALRLAISRERLLERNAYIPEDLPAAMVAIGRPAYAEALALSIRRDSDRVAALGAAATALAAAGDIDGARRLTVLGGELLGNDYIYDTSRAKLIRAAVVTGMVDTAVAVSDSDDTAQRAIVEALLSVGDRSAAETRAATMRDPAERARAFAEVSRAYAVSAESARAKDTLARAERAMRRIRDKDELIDVLSSLARAQLAVGNTRDARRTAERARKIVRHQDSSDEEKIAAAAALLAVGEHHRATALADEVCADVRWVDSDDLTELIARMAEHGLDDWCERTIAAFASPAHQIHCLAAWIANAQTIRPDNLRRMIAMADAAVHRSEHQNSLAHELTALGLALAATGQQQLATRWVERAEVAARSSRPEHRWRGPLALVAAVAVTGDLSLSLSLMRRAATRWAAEFEDDEWEADFRDRMIGWLAERVVRTGSAEDALDLVALTELIENTEYRHTLLAGLAGTFAAAGDFATVRSLAEHLEDHAQCRSMTLSRATAAAARAGHPEIADSFLAEAGALADTVEGPHTAAHVLCHLADAYTAIGDPKRAAELLDRATSVARTLTCSTARQCTFNQIIELSVAAQRTEFAEDLARSIDERFWRAYALCDLMRALVDNNLLEDIGKLSEEVHRLADAAETTQQRVHLLCELCRIHASVPGRAALPRYADVTAELIAGTYRGVAWQATLNRRLLQIPEDEGDHHNLPTEFARDLLDIMIEAGELDWAAEHLELVNETNMRADIRAALTEAVAAAGDIDRAQELALGQRDSADIARALSAIAPHAQPDRARQLLTLALTLGDCDWAVTAQAIAAIDPEAIVEAAQHDAPAPASSRAPTRL